MTDQPYMTPADLVKRFKSAFTERTLKRWRWRRTRKAVGEQGPAFVRISGSIRYHVEDVAAWEAALRKGPGK